MSIGILPHALRKEKHLALLPVSSVNWPLGNLTMHSPLVTLQLKTT
jgi:hypothetical protein